MSGERLSCEHRYLRVNINQQTRTVRNVTCFSYQGSISCGKTFKLEEINRQRKARGEEPLVVKVKPREQAQ